MKVFEDEDHRFYDQRFYTKQLVHTKKSNALPNLTYLYSRETTGRNEKRIIFGKLNWPNTWRIFFR